MIVVASVVAASLVGLYWVGYDHGRKAEVIKRQSIAVLEVNKVINKENDRAIKHSSIVSDYLKLRSDFVVNVESNSVPKEPVNRQKKPIVEPKKRINAPKSQKHAPITTNGESNGKAACQYFFGVDVNELRELQRITALANQH